MKELLWGSKSDAEGAEEPEGPEVAAFAPYDPFAPPVPSGALDLRGYIQILADARYLTQVRERVDWKHGIGRWTRSRQKPLLFENVKDYPGQRVFTNGFNEPVCIAVALGFHAGLPHARVIAQARKRLRDPIAPRMVHTGPVMENVVPSMMIDLLQFPVPQWNEKDAGRFIGTWHLNVSKDPDTGLRSEGMYRMKVMGPKQATIAAPRRSDLARHVARAEEKRAELPVAVAIGAPEATVIAAGAACPPGMDAFDLAGAWQQKPVELIECGHLEVPAYSEIVIEGFIHPGVRVEDGPWFDYQGKPHSNAKAFLFEATRVMHRDDPIFRGSVSGKPGGENYQVQEFLSQLRLLESQRSRLKQLVHSLFS